MATERDVYNALVGKGFDMAQAAGIMGNIQNESSYNQEAIGDGGLSFGLVQWYTPSYPFAPSLVTGNLAADLAAQMDHIVTASHGVNMGGSASAVAGAWASQFEKCVGCQPGGAQYIARQQNADRIFQQAKTGNWPSGPGQPGGPGGPPGPSLGGVSAPGLIGATGTLWGIPITWLEPSLNQVTGIVTAVEDVAQAGAQIANVLTQFWQLMLWFFVPSHIVRVFAFILGVPVTAAGIFALSRSGKENMQLPVVGSLPGTGGSYAGVVGILEVMIGSMLLFIAFHQLPASVNSLPALIAYIQSGVAQPPAPTNPGGRI